jgi:DNA mismatch repair protein MutS
MINVDDLNIGREIIPLYDFTLNEGARTKLLELFAKMPATINEVQERQAVIKTILKNWKALEDFSYAKIDFSEAYQFVNKLRKEYADIDKSPAMQKLSLAFSKEKLLKINARLIQFINLMYRLESRYFTFLISAAFPATFANHISIIKGFLSSFSLKNYIDKIQESHLSINDIVQIVKQLNTKINSRQTDVFWNSLFVFEAYWSVAKGISRHRFTIPEFVNSHFININNFYHPAVKKPVKNSLVSHGNMILLTGPNMSGKSTLLKAVSLCVYLAHLGLGVPASACSIPFFHSFSVSINLKDDLKNGYSHFLAEIKNIKSIATEASARNKFFAVFDEIFRGTNPEDALVVAEKAIVGLAKKYKDSFFIVSTHLHGLKAAIEQNPIIEPYFIECKLSDNRPVFSYRFLPGWSDIKIGQLLFKMEGLDELLE